MGCSEGGNALVESGMLGYARRPCGPGHDLFELRHGEPGRAQVLLRVRASRWSTPVRAAEPPTIREDRFCGGCGAALEDGGTVRCPRAPAPRFPSVGSSRSSSPTWSGSRRCRSRRDAEEVRELLTRYFELARTVIDRYGGTVEKFIGDAVMAVWGAPVAKRTTRSAPCAPPSSWSLRSRSSGGRGSELKARAGVLTGEAAVTLGARARAWSPATS